MTPDQPMRRCSLCGRQSLADCCVRCENKLPQRVDRPRTTDARPEWSRVEDSIRGPLGTSTRDSTWAGEVLKGDALAAWDDDPRVIRFVEDVAGTIESGRPLTCRYAAATSGQVHDLSASEYGVWKRRLLLESGLVPHPAVALAVLPVDAGVHARELWPSIELLIQARLLGGTPADAPLPLTRRFLRRWVPMGERPVRTAMEELIALEFVTLADTHVPNRGWPMNLWCVRVEGRRA